MVRFFLILSLFSLSYLFADTCTSEVILGTVFPQIDGLSCPEYSLILGFTSIVSSYIFYIQVLK